MSRVARRLLRHMLPQPGDVLTVDGYTRTVTLSWVEGDGRLMVRYQTPGGRQRNVPFDRWWDWERRGDVVAG